MLFVNLGPYSIFNILFMKTQQQYSHDSYRIFQYWTDEGQTVGGQLTNSPFETRRKYSSVDEYRVENVGRVFVNGWTNTLPETWGQVVVLWYCCGRIPCRERGASILLSTKKTYWTNTILRVFVKSIPIRAGCAILPFQLKHQLI